MNLLHYRPAQRFHMLICGAALIAAPLAQATSYTIFDDGTSASIDVNSSAGMYNWSVQDSSANNYNQLNQQWFWYRVGNGAQGSIDTLPFAGAAVSGNNAAHNNILTTSYNNGLFNVQVSYILHGGGLGSGAADIGEAIYIHNLTASPLDFHFYQYSDFNLLNNPLGDSVVMDSGSAFQSKGVSQLAEGIIDPNASHFEANVTGGTGSTLYRFANTPGLVLNDSPSASGDVTWAFEWDVTIGANGNTDDTFAIVKDKALSIVPLPEPGIASLLGLGALALLGLRRQVRR